MKEREAETEGDIPSSEPQAEATSFLPAPTWATEAKGALLGCFSWALAGSQMGSALGVQGGVSPTVAQWYPTQISFQVHMCVCTRFLVISTAYLANGVLVLAETPVR